MVDSDKSRLRKQNLFPNPSSRGRIDRGNPTKSLRGRSPWQAQEFPLYARDKASLPARLPALNLIWYRVRNDNSLYRDLDSRITKSRGAKGVPLSLFLLGRIYFLLDDQLQSFGPPV